MNDIGKHTHGAKSKAKLTEPPALAWHSPRSLRLLIPFPSHLLKLPHERQRLTLRQPVHQPGGHVASRVEVVYLASVDEGYEGDGGWEESGT